jgi:N-acetylglucosaminyldiphosphoundecaprenol N-acetyl-beta-D-mannosaminyltransferase
LASIDEAPIDGSISGCHWGPMVCGGLDGLMANAAVSLVASPAVHRSSGIPGHQRVRIGRLWIDALTVEQGLDAIRELVARGRGGTVFTPNVDHVVMAETDAAFRRAYRQASLSFADGVPLIWASRLLRSPLPAKLSGSDMILPIARLAAREGWRVYLLGGAPGAAGAAAKQLREAYGVEIAGVDDSLVRLDEDSDGQRLIVERIRRARPHLIFVALGAPKQELWSARVLDAVRPAVAIGIGASLDFVAGHVRRAPSWISRLGLEWLYRLAQEPRRLWRRYLLRDPAFVLIVLRALWRPRRQRVRVS